MSRSFASVLALGLGLLTASPVLAQSVPEDPQHGDHGVEGDIVITAILGRNQQDILAGTSVLTSTELARDEYKQPALAPRVPYSVSRRHQSCLCFLSNVAFLLLNVFLAV